MKPPIRTLVSATLLSLLAACSDSPDATLSARPAPSSSLVMECGLLQIAVQSHEASVTLRIDDKRYRLLKVSATPGTRYELPDDPDTFFWLQHDSALLQLKGQLWPTCGVPGAILEPFRAGGNEPFWSVHLDDGMLTLHYPGETLLSVAYRIARPGVEQQTVRAVLDDEPLELTLTAGICRDTMSGMPFPRSARLQLGEALLSGCAGQPERLIQGADWTVQTIGEHETLADSRPTLHFTADGKILGHGACNHYGGNYTLSGEGLQIDTLYSTKMACAPEIMEQEQYFLTVLGQVERFDLAEDNALLLIGRRGTIRAYRQ